MNFSLLCRILLFALCSAVAASAMPVVAQEKQTNFPPTAADLALIVKQRDLLRSSLEKLRDIPETGSRERQALLADVAVFEKAASWMLRFQEFPKKDYVDQLRAVLDKGLDRAEQLQQGTADWARQPGTTIHGYVSAVDGSVQPYALTIPEGIDPKAGHRWPLHVVLHGRADQMNEVNFIHRMDGKPLSDKSDQPPQTWIQLDVYGRGNNAYRWAGETDVFEAMADVKRRFRIDDDRITLHGFSMGGAGAWHLGMHYPSIWSSVGPGAGFVDYYRYQKKDPNNPAQRLPEPQHTTLGIYDSIDYALNGFNVPVCTYGGEKDAQLLAGASMTEAAKLLDVDIRLIIGPNMGHAFDPVSRQQFMAFHLEHAEHGRPRPGERKHVRFTTRTLRYNNCDWITIEEVDRVYQPATVEARINEEGDMEITTENVAAVRINRDMGTDAVIDGTVLECRTAADGLLPDVYFVKTDTGWQLLDYGESRGFSDNPERHKRHGLQGPIDDALMSSFVCVRGTGDPWNGKTQRWADWTLTRFEEEFAQWMRGDIRVVDDSAVDEQLWADNHLILFGDPGSNSVLKRILADLPVEWTSEQIRIGQQQWACDSNGLSLIFPNPLNPAKYVVINSGHTFHEKEFRSTNAMLFPRLGDIAVQSFEELPNQGNFTEQTVWAEVFDANWRLAGLK
ncbi:MAG: prolyl oligopeptidase family serine peptidase [Planctomycetaceae bacterium]